MKIFISGNFLSVGYETVQDCGLSFDVIAEHLLILSWWKYRKCLYIPSDRDQSCPIWRELSLSHENTIASSTTENYNLSNVDLSLSSEHSTRCFFCSENNISFIQPSAVGEPGCWRSFLAGHSTPAPQPRCSAYIIMYPVKFCHIDITGDRKYEGGRTSRPDTRHLSSRVHRLVNQPTTWNWSVHQLLGPTSHLSCPRVYSNCAVRTNPTKFLWFYCSFKISWSKDQWSTFFRNLVSIEIWRCCQL